MQDKTLTGGQALVRLLANYGVDTVFGIPGVHTLEPVSYTHLRAHET
mgnify:CR=1 FL=1